MAVPIINPIQSVLGFLQWQAFEFLPSALNEPTEWHCSALPPGLFFDEDTGAIFGAVIVPGVFSFVLTAENGSGTSAPLTFTLGIEASGFIAPATILDLSIDTITRRVTVAGILANAGSSGAEANAAGATEETLSPLFWMKSGDDLILNVRFTKGGVQLPPDLTALKFALKEVEPDETILEAGGDGDDMVKIGSGENASFRIYASLEDDDIAAALSNYEDDKVTQFIALAEFEWLQNNDAGVGPDEIRGSSRTFGVMVARDLIPNE